MFHKRKKNASETRIGVIYTRKCIEMDSSHSPRY